MSDQPPIAIRTAAQELRRRWPLDWCSDEDAEECVRVVLSHVYPTPDTSLNDLSAITDALADSDRVKNVAEAIGQALVDSNAQDAMQNAAIAAIKVMEDASTRKDGECIGTTAQISGPANAVITSSANSSYSTLQPESITKQNHNVSSSEISLDAEKLLDVVDEYLHWRKVNPHIKGGENYLKRLRAATPMPVSVSLKKTLLICVSAWDGKQYSRHHETPEIPRGLESGIKAVLDAAGMKYVD